MYVIASEEKVEKVERRSIRKKQTYGNQHVTTNVELVNFINFQ